MITYYEILLPNTTKDDKVIYDEWLVQLCNQIGPQTRVSGRDKWAERFCSDVKSGWGVRVLSKKKGSSYQVAGTQIESALIYKIKDESVAFQFHLTFNPVGGFNKVALGDAQ